MRLKEAVSAAGLSAILAVSSGCADQQRKPAQITDGQTRVESVLPDHVALVEYKAVRSSSSQTLQKEGTRIPDTVMAQWIPQGQESILYLDEGGRLGLKNQSSRNPIFISDGIKYIARHCGLNISNTDFSLNVTDGEYFDEKNNPRITNVVRRDGRVKEVQVSARFARNEGIRRNPRTSSVGVISRAAGIAATEAIVLEFCTIGGKPDAGFRASSYARSVSNGEMLPAITILSPGNPRG